MRPKTYKKNLALSLTHDLDLVRNFLFCYSAKLGTDMNKWFAAGTAFLHLKIWFT